MDKDKARLLDLLSEARDILRDYVDDNREDDGLLRVLGEIEEKLEEHDYD